MLKLKCVLLFLTVLISFTAWSQSVFLSQINGQSRVYLYANTAESSSEHNPTATYNKPLFIIVHPGKSSPQEIFQSEEKWKAISSAVNLIFPRGWKDTWDCADSLQVQNDVSFFTEIISSSFSNFKIDRNRVYVITLSGTSCLGEVLGKETPGSIAQVVNLTSGQSSSTYVIREIERLLASEKKTETTYSFYHRPRLDVPTNPIDSLKQSSWHQRWVVSIHTGGLAMLGWSKTDSDDGTYMDLSDYHSFTGLEVTKWMNDSIAWFFDVSRLKVPMKQEMGTTKMTIGGGMIVPITLGFKYQLFRNETYKPYVMLGTGPMQVMAFGGKVAASSSTSPSSIMRNVNNEMRMIFHTTIGGGVDVRFGKRIVIGSQLRYIHSAKFEAAASLNSVRAFTLNFSAGFILNANNERSLKNLLK